MDGHRSGLSISDRTAQVVISILEEREHLTLVIFTIFDNQFLNN